MSKHGLVIYKIKISRSEDGAACLPCNTIASDGRTLAEVIWDELGKVKVKAYDNKYDKKLSIRTSPTDENVYELENVGGSILGRINYGFYGDAAEIYDEKDQFAFQKTPKHTSAMPMFFELLVNRRNHQPYAIFQTYKIMGIKTLFSQFMSSNVKKMFPKYHIELLPYWPQDVKDKLFGSDGLNYVKITSRKRLKDKSDLPIVADPDLEIIVEEKITFVSPRKAKKDSIKAKLKSLEPEISDFSNDDSVRSVTLGINENGRDRGIKIGTGLGRAPAFDVYFNASEQDIDHHPKFSAYKDASQKLKQKYSL